MALDGIRPKLAHIFQYDPFPDLKDIFSNYYYVNSNPITFYDYFGLYSINYESCKCLSYFPISGPANIACNFFVPIVREKFAIRGDCMAKMCKDISFVCKDRCKHAGWGAYISDKEYKFFMQNKKCYGGKCNIYLCPRFKEQPLRNKACIIIHELAHWCGATEKGSYYLSDMFCTPYVGSENITVTPK